MGALAYTVNVAIVGNSIAGGQQNNINWNLGELPFAQRAQQAMGPLVQVVDAGQPGEQAAGWVPLITQGYVDQMLSLSAALNVVVLEVGSNDLAAGAVLATLEGNLRQAMQYIGARANNLVGPTPIVVCTVLPRADVSVSDWTATNAWIRANAAFYGGTVCDFAGDALMGHLATITAATGAGVTPVQLTIPGHGLNTGEPHAFTQAAGNTAINGTWTVTVLDPNTITIPRTGNGTYTASSGKLCDSFNATYYAADNVHCNDAGYRRLASGLFVPALLSVIP